MPSTLADMTPVLHTVPALATLRGLMPGDSCYLVGGTLRDALLGLPLHDIDIVSADDPTPCAQEFAERLSSPWFWLDEGRRLSRVLVAGDDTWLTFDFAPFRAADLAADLAARDYTINSLALPLASPFDNAHLIDPLGGREDLRRSLLRMCGPEAFVADPLRILKGLRHAVVLGFVIDETTCQAMMHHGWRLETVSVERVRKEFWAILAHEAAENGLRLLASTGIGALLFGDLFNEKLESMVAVLRRCQAVCSRLALDSATLSRWQAESVADGLDRRGLLLSTFVLAAIDALHPQMFAERWRLSRRARARIRGLMTLNRAVVDQLCRLERRPRLLSLWADKHGLDVLDLVLAASIICDDEQRDTVLSWVPLAEEACRQTANDLVDGDWLTTEIGIPAGPQIGEALEFVREYELLGRVASRADAEQLLRRYWTLTGRKRD
ncbi:MAG: hypothetical protein RQ723_09885 [Desulfuromonadales bacterium]|nr:hypothetical protein [Desulfuromonadales bacterium]